MKYLLLSIYTLFFPFLAYAQENNAPLTVRLSFWDVLFSILAPTTFFVLAYLLIKKFKL